MSTGELIVLLFSLLFCAYLKISTIKKIGRKNFKLACNFDVMAYVCIYLSVICVENLAFCISNYTMPDIQTFKKIFNLNQYRISSIHSYKSVEL